MNLDKLDLSRCLYDPRQSDFLSKLKEFSEFAADIPYKIPKKKVMTYVVLIYDMESPLRKEVRDITARRLVALDLAGFKRDKKTDRFDRPIELFLEGRNPQITSMIVKYIILQNDPRWTQLVVYEHMLYMESARALLGAYKNADTMSKSIDRLATSKDKLTAELIGGKEEAEPILAALYKQATKGLDISPEKVSDYIQTKKNEGGQTDVPDDWNPYNVWKDNEVSEWYKVSQIKYVGAK